MDFFLLPTPQIPPTSLPTQLCVFSLSLSLKKKNQQNKSKDKKAKKLKTHTK